MISIKNIFYPKYFFIFPLVLGFFLRLTVIINNGYGPTYDAPASTDEVHYRELARNINENRIFACWTEGFFTQSMRAPAYPAMLAFANFAIPSRWTPLILNLLLDTANILLIYILAKRLFGMLAANLSAFVYAIFAPSFIYLRFSTPEIFSVFLLLLLVISMIAYKKILSLEFISISILYTLLIHSRPAFLPLIPILPLVIFLKIRKKDFSIGKKILASIAPAAVIAILCLPWTFRNYMIHKQFVPVIVIPVWHGVESARTDSFLPLDFAMDFIYSPERESWTEGEYFQEAKMQCAKTIRKNHFKIFLFGIFRLINSWFFPQIYYRIFLPQAYFNPIAIYNSIPIVLPDFEGIIYLTIIFLIFAIFAKKRKSLEDIYLILKNNSWLILFISSYLAVHIIAIPFPQYRFIVEPLIAIFAVAIILKVIYPEEDAIDKNQKFRFANIISMMLPLLLFLPLIFNKSAPAFIYPGKSSELLSYEELRGIQWQNKGFVPENLRAELCGRVRYINNGFKFCAKDESPAKRDPVFAAGKLYVMENSKQYKFAQGDVKLNFNSRDFPDENDYIYCEGTVEVGIYRDLTLNVEKWERLNE